MEGLLIVLLLVGVCCGLPLLVLLGMSQSKGGNRRDREEW